jgi:phospholipid/cholesterol/gamma-HCH transport system substrate-binding protein
VTTFVRNQLIVFTALTITAFALIFFVYLQVPALLGFGRDTVTVELPQAGGIYPNANVTYRGYTIGRVTDVELVPGGVKATLSVNDDQMPPANSKAEVHSVSAIGEQFVDFVPQPGGDGQLLADGADIPLTRSSIPPPTAAVLDGTNNLLASVKPGQLNTVLDEGSAAFKNLGPDLGRLLDNTKALVATAQQNYPQTHQLIGDGETFLNSQLASSNDLRSWTKDLTSFSAAVKQSDGHLRGTIDNGLPAARQANDLLAQLAPVTPTLLNSTDTLAKLADAYHAGIEQVLVVYPMVTAAVQTNVPSDRPGLFNFNLTTTVNNPNCSFGWVPPGQPGGARNSNELSDEPLPPNSYCKIPQNNPLQARSARQLPCFEPGSPPGRRAALITECRGSGYKPLGTGPVSTQTANGTTNLPTTNITQDGSGLAMLSPLDAIGAPATPAPSPQEMTWQGLLLNHG